MGYASTSYRAKRAALTGNQITTAYVPRLADDGTKAVIVYVFGANKVRNNKFRIKAVGKAKSGTTSNFTMTIAKGNDIVAANNTNIATTGAIALASAPQPIVLEAEGSWISEGNKMTGVFQGWGALTAVARAIWSAAITGVDPSGDSVPFTLSILFGTTDPGNDFELGEFSMEVL